MQDYKSYNSNKLADSFKTKWSLLQNPVFFVGLIFLFGITITLYISTSSNTTDSLPLYEGILDENSTQMLDSPLESHSVELELLSQSNTPSMPHAFKPNNKLNISHNLQLDKTLVVKPGDTMAKLFNEAHIPASTLYDLLKLKPFVEHSRKLVPGQKITFTANNEQKLTKLTYYFNPLKALVITKDNIHYKASILTREPVEAPKELSGTVHNSFYLSAKNAGLSSQQIMSLINIFKWEIDFKRDMKSGDRFNIIYNMQYIDGKPIGKSAIKAAQIINGNKTYTAIRYTDKAGNIGYFRPDGSSMQKAFLRSPVKYTRISDPFNPRRMHPILHIIRPHNGTDFAAPRWTPIKATANGRIEFAGWKGGYGRVVIIRHPNGYKTVYGHMQKFGKNIKSGKYVKQGTMIGYVGTSGLATGPHVHYEVRINNKPRDPMKVKLPNGKGIARTELAEFKKIAALRATQLDLMHQSRIAANETQTRPQPI